MVAPGERLVRPTRTEQRRSIERSARVAEIIQAGRELGRRDHDFKHGATDVLDINIETVERKRDPDEVDTIKVERGIRIARLRPAAGAAEGMRPVNGFAVTLGVSVTRLNFELPPSVAQHGIAEGTLDPDEPAFGNLEHRYGVTATAGESDLTACDRYVFSDPEWGIIRDVCACAAGTHGDETADPDSPSVDAWAMGVAALDDREPRLTVATMEEIWDLDAAVSGVDEANALADAQYAMQQDIVALHGVRMLADLRRTLNRLAEW